MNNIETGVENSPVLDSLSSRYRQRILTKNIIILIN
jgi:hypothetical protein